MGSTLLAENRYSSGRSSSPDFPLPIGLLRGIAQVAQVLTFIDRDILSSQTVGIPDRADCKYQL